MFKTRDKVGSSWIERGITSAIYKITEFIKKSWEFGSKNVTFGQKRHTFGYSLEDTTVNYKTREKNKSNWNNV